MFDDIPSVFCRTFISAFMPFLACWNFKYISYLLIFANYLLCFFVSRFYLVLTNVFPFLGTRVVFSLFVFHVSGAELFSPLLGFLSVTTVSFVTMSNFYYHSPLWFWIMNDFLVIFVCMQTLLRCLCFHISPGLRRYLLLSFEYFVLHCFNADLICDCFLQFFTHLVGDFLLLRNCVTCQLIDCIYFWFYFYV